MRAASWSMIVVLLGAILDASPVCATAGLAEWTIYTPGGHVIAHTDAWQQSDGVGLGTDLERDPIITNLRRWRYHPDAVVGKTDKDFFLLREKSRTLTRYASEEALAAALKQQRIGEPLSDWYEPQHGWAEAWFPVLTFRRCRAPEVSGQATCQRFLSQKGLALQRLTTWGHICARRPAQHAPGNEPAELEIDAYCKLLRDSPAAASSTQWRPHAPQPVHPPEVERIMKLLPRIPNSGSVDEIIALLGLPKKWDGGSVSATECTMVWNLPDGYKLSLSFDPIHKAGKLTLKFSEASFSAPNKPGFPPDEQHTVFPYRSVQGMRYK